jgi:YspA, cpYpsA-related SLOG family
MTRVLVTGGRNYKDRTTLVSTLDGIHTAMPITMLLLGGAPGADFMAWGWASDNDVPVTVIRADWEKYGKRAGPIRNAALLNEGPDFILAFPGGRGTADCCRQARDRGIPVREVSP